MIQLANKNIHDKYINKINCKTEFLTGLSQPEHFLHDTPTAGFSSCTDVFPPTHIANQ